MTDPYYAHEFNPNRKGKCKFIYGGKNPHHCAEPEDALVHRRYREQQAQLEGAQDTRDDH